MALPALKEAFEQLSIMPPSFRLGDMLDLVRDLKGFERAVDDFDLSVIKWKANTRAGLRDGFEHVLRLARDFPKDEVAAVMLPTIDELLETLSEVTRAYAAPFSENPKTSVALAKITSVGGDAGRFLRKQIRKAEATRAKQVDALADLHFELLAFRAEFDPDAQPTGRVLRSAEDLQSYLEGLSVR